MFKKYRRKKKYIKLRCYRAIKKLKLSFFFAVEIFSVKKIGLTILDYTYEPVRYFFKEFLFLLSTRLNFYNYFSFFLTIKSKVVYFIVKYFGTFFFVLWILYESFFLRFYLVDMPQDDKLPIDRKEISSFWLYRYLPIFFVDSHVFLARPAWRVFNTFRVVLANLRALSQLIYIVYFESLFDFLS